MKGDGVYSKKNPRIPFFYWAFGFAFLFLIGALAYRQIYLYDYYVECGERQSMRRVIEPGTRGDIYDRNGKVIKNVTSGDKGDVEDPDNTPGGGEDNNPGGGEGKNPGGGEDNNPGGDLGL